MTATHVARSLHAELIRTAGNSRLWTLLMPAAIAVPVSISFGIAWAAESFARIPGQLAVLQVPTSNAGYWVITITVALIAVAAADGQSCENRYRSADYVRLAFPGQWSVLSGRWLFYGTLGAAVAAVTLLLVLVALPVLSPVVYGTVSATDGVGTRMLWTTAVLAFFAAGAGVGVGALLRSPVAAMGAILFWAFVIEPAAGYLPNGVFVQRFLPVLNGVYASGQDTVLVPPWDQNIALLFVCALSTAIFLVATVERNIRHA